MMIFEYGELKEYVKEDFDVVENICIHVLSVLNYTKNELNYKEIIEKLNQLMRENVENMIKVELGSEYMKFIADLNDVRSDI